MWELFSSHYLVPDSPPTALLDRVRKGCFSVTWLVPTGLISQLVKRVQLETEFFRKHRILKVTVGKECVYKEIAEEITSVSSLEAYFERVISLVYYPYHQNFCMMCYRVGSLGNYLQCDKSAVLILGTFFRFHNYMLASKRPTNCIGYCWLGCNLTASLKMLAEIPDQWLVHYQ